MLDLSNPRQEPAQRSHWCVSSFWRKSSILTHFSGVEREMNVCHTQPHLVPPMKLVVYEDLPSPNVRQHRNSLSSWLNESRNLASRASTRASMPMKRSSTMPLKISAPSDFRRVQSFQSPASYERQAVQPARNYQPLDLRIHRSGNRLSDLPSFDSFQLNESPQRMTLPAPPRALTPTSVRDRRCQTTFVVSRKPVGSVDRRSLGNSVSTKEPVRISSGLVPHFSTVTPVEIPVEEVQATSPSPKSIPRGSTLSLSTPWPSQGGDDTQPWGRVPRTPPSSRSLHMDSATASPSKYSPTSKNSPSSASSHSLPTMISSRCPSLPFSDRNTFPPTHPPLSNRVTDWIFSADKPTKTPPEDFNWERARTLSGTTVASTSTVTGRARNNGSISTVFSSAMTPRTSFSFHPSPPEKDVDATLCQPTIFEGQQHEDPFCGYRGIDQTRLESGIGLAF